MKTKSVETKTLNLKIVRLDIGETLDLKTLISEEEAESVEKWASANKDIATVSKKGLLTLRKYGKVVITATCGNGAKIKFNFSFIDKKSDDGLDIKHSNEAFDAGADTASGSGDTEMAFELE